MRKFVIIPDSFKGTLSSAELCEIMKEVIKKHYKDCEVISIPVADGGEGSVDCFLTALGGEKVKVQCHGPYGEEIEGFYGRVNASIPTAVVEMAAAAGLPMVGEKKDPSKTSTFGVGEIINQAVKDGCRDIIVALGGSCTNDFGCGAAAALGVKFIDKAGQEFIPTGGTLSQVSHIDRIECRHLLKDVHFTTMCDIDNPVFGMQGAAYVFAPQKGADPEMVQELDRGLQDICKVIEKDIGIDVSKLPGGGAAGAMGAGMYAFFNAELKMGIDTVLDITNFDELILGADAVFTGEGKMDTQSLRGKAVIGVARRAKKHRIPVIAVVGGADNDIDEAYKEGVTAVFTINRLPEDFSVSRYKSHDNFMNSFDNIVRLIKTYRS